MVVSCNFNTNLTIPGGSLALQIKQQSPNFLLPGIKLNDCKATKDLPNKVFRPAHSV